MDISPIPIYQDFTQLHLLVTKTCRKIKYGWFRIFWLLNAVEIKALV